MYLSINNLGFFLFFKNYLYIYIFIINYYYIYNNINTIKNTKKILNLDYKHNLYQEAITCRLHIFFNFFLISFA